uniref:Uncharacterized protein n=1 Tax=Glossina austeni TaxID=7395 RepID=A0A1A9VT95_GLOAU
MKISWLSKSEVQSRCLTLQKKGVQYYAILCRKAPKAQSFQELNKHTHTHHALVHKLMRDERPHKPHLLVGIEKTEIYENDANNFPLDHYNSISTSIFKRYIDVQMIAVYAKCT